ncbi:MAG: glycosyltransferase family 4 protein [Acidobacteria bacterium]|nr:glycosyltransferase family 4 protein [Acidobacteriota bacterium]
MRLLCVLNGGVDHPSSRLRVLQHLDLLKGRGIDPDVFVAKGTRAVDLVDLSRRARRADAVLVQKKLFTRWKLPLLLGPAPLLFDLDDAVFAVSTDERERFGEDRAERRARSRRLRLAAVLRRSRAVFAGNGFLADYARRFASNVTVLPTGVDLRPFPDEAVRRAREARRGRGAGARVGWIGSRPGLRYLEILAEPLRRVVEKNPQARFVQVCSAFVDLPGVPTDTIGWSRENETAALLDFDVGVMPLDESPFSQGKCGFKILMYYAAGLPVVCSPVGANRELVVHGETGFLARTADEWASGLELLFADPDLGAAMGERGRTLLRERYGAMVIGSQLADRIAAAVGHGPAGQGPAGSAPAPRGTDGTR